MNIARPLCSRGRIGPTTDRYRWATRYWPTSICARWVSDGPDPALPSVKGTTMKKINRSDKKMLLNRETIVALQTEALDYVIGGNACPSCVTQCPNCPTRGCGGGGGQV